MDKNDPLGKAFSDYLKENSTKNITVYSNIAETEYWPVSYFFRNKDEMPELEKIAMQKCSGKILEIGAGAGAHALELQNNGSDITALDYSKGAVETMQKRGVNKTVCSSIFDFSSHEKFDTILMLMNGIGVAGTIEGYKLLLEKLKLLLNKNGKLIFDSADISYLFQTEDGEMMININDDYFGELSYQFEYKNEKSENFNWLFLQFDIAAMYAEECGYECTLIYENETQYLAEFRLKN